MSSYFFIANNLTELLAIETYLVKHALNDKFGKRGPGTLFWLDRYVDDPKPNLPLALGVDDSTAILSWHQPFPYSDHTTLHQFINHYKLSYGELYPTEVALYPYDYPEYYL